MLHVDRPVQLDHIGQNIQSPEHCQWIVHIEHIDYGVDPRLSGLIDGQLYGLLGSESRYHHCIGGGVSSKAHLQVSRIQGLEIQYDKSPRPDGPNLFYHTHPQHLDQRGPHLDQDVIALRQS